MIEELLARAARNGWLLNNFAQKGDTPTDWFANFRDPSATIFTFVGRGATAVAALEAAVAKLPTGESLFD